MTKLQLRFHETPSNGPQFVPALIMDGERVSTSDIEFGSHRQGKSDIWGDIPGGTIYTLEAWGADGTRIYFETNEAPTRIIEDSGATVYTWDSAAVTMD